MAHKRNFERQEMVAVVRRIHAPKSLGKRVSSLWVGQSLDIRCLIPAGIQVDPLTGLAPAGFHLRYAEQAVALFADEFGAVPFEEIV